MTSPTELYRFASVRAIANHASDALTKRFIVLGKDSDTAKMQAAYPNSFFFKLNALNEYPAARLKALVDQEKRTSKLILKPEDLASAFPIDIQSFFAWAYTGGAKLADLKKHLSESLDSPKVGVDVRLKAFVNDSAFLNNKFTLYESLAIQYLAPDPASFLSSIQDMIRFAWLVQRVVLPDNAFAVKLEDDPKHIEQAVRATIVLPLQRPFSPVVDDTQSTPKSGEDEVNNASDRLKKLNEALADIEDKHNAQFIDNAYAARYSADRGAEQHAGPALRKSATLLASRYVESLSRNTHEVVDDLRIPKGDGIDIGHANARIELERKRIIDKYFPLPQSPVVVNINGRFIEAPRACIPYVYNPCAQYSQVPVAYKKMPLRTPGWADLKVIKSTLLKYEKGEIAHIENVLEGEIKVREFNVIKKTEETVMTDIETTTEDQKELQSTDRFEMERELSSQLKEDMKFDTGVKVSASMGAVQLDTHLDFAYGSSKEDSNKTSTKTAQELVSRALSKVIERNRTQRTVSTIVTTEDKNSHTLKNDTNPAGNVHGMYFWVDKLYLAKVVNYGTRYMLEFIVPEPAAFYLYSKINKPQPENAKLKPQYPQVRTSSGGFRDIASFKDITEQNYAELAARYEAADITPPFSDILVITEAVEVKNSADEVISSDRNGTQTKFKQAALADKAITVDDGYEPQWGAVTVAGWMLSNVTIILGNESFNAGMGSTLNFGLNSEKKIVPFSVWGYDTGSLVCNVEITCKLSASKRDEWRIKTFNSVLAAYRKQLTDYEEWQKEQEINSGISIQGNNPEMNRRIEREELKKLCIELMTGQTFEAFNAVNSNVAPFGYPEIIADKAFEQGKHTQFFEQVFEWEQATYVFYPYFWGRKPNWVMIKSINDADPVFTSFLQAGAARVLVPTRRGFADSVNYFLATQRIWNGKNPPIPGDPIWISIVDELKAQEGQFDGGQQDGVPWIYKVSTSLVYLEKTAFSLQDTDASADYPNDLKQIAQAKTTADFS